MSRQSSPQLYTDITSSRKCEANPLRKTLRRMKIRNREERLSWICLRRQAIMARPPPSIDPEPETPQAGVPSKPSSNWPPFSATEWQEHAPPASPREAGVLRRRIRFTTKKPREREKKRGRPSLIFHHVFNYTPKPYKIKREQKKGKTSRTQNYCYPRGCHLPPYGLAVAMVTP